MCIKPRENREGKFLSFEGMISSSKRYFFFFFFLLQTLYSCHKRELSFTSESRRLLLRLSPRQFSFFKSLPLYIYIYLLEIFISKNKTLEILVPLSREGRFISKEGEEGKRDKRKVKTIIHSSPMCDNVITQMLYGM